nr:uncharacterized mitochondrial protein AtMg00810-like [Tanacetum cinerariifolium]
MQDKKSYFSFFHVFGALCYPTNDNDDLSKLDTKAYIGIFIGYAPAKKTFRIYNNRTQKFIETIYVTFDELTAMAFEQFSLGPGLHFMILAASSSRLVPNTISQQPFLVVVTPRAVDLADSPVSTLIVQDAPSASITSTQEQEHSPNISQGFEESPKTPYFHDDPLHESLHEDWTSQQSSSNVRPIYTPFESLSRWTKNHHIENVIGDPSRSAKPTEKHLNAVKRIFRYLKRTINMGLWYLEDTGMSLRAYANADHAGCQDTRRSKSESAQFLGDKLVSWSSKKQKSTAISST